MGCPCKNLCYASIIIFIIPLIVLSSLILSINIETENLEKIIDTPQNQSDCYEFTYSFIKDQSTDERYISLNSYLQSLKPLCIVIIVFYSLKTIYTPIFSCIVEQDNRDSANGMYVCFIDAPARIISFIPIIVCVILLRIRGYTTKCQAFMDYYEECSKYYGSNFVDNFKSIMRINTFTLCIVILFVWEVVYHLIIALLMLC